VLSSVSEQTIKENRRLAQLVRELEILKNATRIDPETSS
jgi:hypothetical protein